MTTSKLPAIQFYPGDWRKDMGVQSLSFHDRGVWFELLCLMHDSEIRGKLILGGRPMGRESMARLLGIPVDELAATMETLLETGVASRDEETGAIMCRRMVRDEHIRAVRAAAGSLGGTQRVNCETHFAQAKSKQNPSNNETFTVSSNSEEAEAVIEPTEKCSEMGFAQAKVQAKLKQNGPPSSSSSVSVSITPPKSSIDSSRAHENSNASEGDFHESKNEQSKPQGPTLVTPRVGYGPGAAGDDFDSFQETAKSVGMSGSDVDFTEARIKWRGFDYRQKAEAIKGLTDRKGTGDAAIRSLPQNYLGKHMWQREIRPAEPAKQVKQDQWQADTRTPLERERASYLCGVEDEKLRGEINAYFDSGKAQEDYDARNRSSKNSLQ